MDPENLEGEKTMRCPVCKAVMTSSVCSCGYDESRNYEKYPTFGVLPVGIETACGMQNRRNDLIQCGSCGGYAFTLNRKTGALVCAGCGRMLTEPELEPLLRSMGGKSEPVQKKEPVISGQTDSRRLLSVLGQIQQQLSTESSGDPRRIVAIAAGWSHTVALYADGTVAAIGDNGEGECDLSSWQDIIAICADNKCTTGLKKDGTVVTTSLRLKAQVREWRDITAIAMGLSHIVGLKKDGTVVTTGGISKRKFDVSQWRNIQSIAAGGTFTLGLETSGKVVVSGNGSGTKLPFGGWQNVKAIAAGYGHSAALTNDGRVLMAGLGGIISDLGTSNIDLEAGCYFTAVRKQDGTALVTGMDGGARNNVLQWRDLEQIAAGYYHMVGLKTDGTLVAVGDNAAGQCEVHKLVRK